ncbi:hypothetical protein GS597_14645 [Synechococcales cyanobacterium C]|uniref:Uncharacterized protein n=1 Tax=Petrachloros mirabilis ULC683 TaxID=2781853 RepID=A0A8K1ZYN2_9CYAN|nr:hypothetical protein [Petrachloros mirabilis]NCJ07725.1 hypothetical protein [Petrachloros mirabilis ULC683]
MSVKSLAFVTTACLITLSAPATQVATAQGGLPEETEINLVTQVSKQLATNISGQSCDQFAQLLSTIKPGTTTTDPNSLIGNLLNSVRTKPNLRAIAVSELGEPLITKLLDCNMIPIEALMP